MGQDELAKLDHGDEMSDGGRRVEDDGFLHVRTKVVD